MDHDQISQLLRDGSLTAHGNETQLRINFVTGTLISVSYDTLQGNQPNTNGNKLFIWQNPNVVPWNVTPLNQQNIATNTPSGSANLTGLEVTKDSYIVGYAVGPDVSDICASAFVPAGSDVDDKPHYEYDSVSLSIKFIGSTSVAIGYHTLSGYQPLSQGNVLGMWEGNTASYSTPPKWTAKPSGDSPNGVASFNNVKIIRDATYTVAYMMGSKQTTMAATITFST